MLCAAEGQTGFRKRSNCSPRASGEQARRPSLIPDETRTCPLPLLFRYLAELAGPRAPSSISSSHGNPPADPRGRINGILPSNAAVCGDRPSTTTESQDTFSPQPDSMNGSRNYRRPDATRRAHRRQRMIFDYDQLVILGPRWWASRWAEVFLPRHQRLGVHVSLLAQGGDHLHQDHRHESRRRSAR